MIKKWFQHNEVLAGSKRLYITYRLYKLFGGAPLYLIAFFVSLFAFLGAKARRNASFNYFKILQQYTNRSFSIILSSYKQFFNYGNSLADKIISFSGDFKDDNFKFQNDAMNEVKELIKNNKGMFFLTTHIGNVEIMRSLLNSKDYPKPPCVNVFLEKRNCEIFNKFLDSINRSDTNLTTYCPDDVGIETAIELKDKLTSGEVIFMAGDRVAFDNPQKTYDLKLFDKKVSFPLGSLKLALMLEAPIFFVVCAKSGKSYNIHAQKFVADNSNKKQTIEKLKKEYGEFIEKFTILYPCQFYNFYNLFSD